jgi:hypothetical protein
VENLSRRRVLRLAAAGWAVSAVHPRRAWATGPERANRRIPVLHVTDLFRPHMDPDDEGHPDRSPAREGPGSKS